ncbi:grasp-with-spasm system ATP-grasp peptide maturase [Pedobacter jeongneungensis]|uniref:grasp-with-spasm system ATP-grasp peptide maturase n=1 Tax=Pedobacter jeongneungensis TaxID=947309 RepID=UPI00046AEE2A|nr:grasp-with-spasm system ATP-grasp peptide maturase [Pedobacter jeongneungensis]
MILILSSHGDDSTDYVMDWLAYYKEPVTRINDSDLTDRAALTIELSRSGVSMLVNKNIQLMDAKATWFRKFGLFFESNIYSPSKKLFEGKLHYFMHNEHDALMNAIYAPLSLKTKWLCNPLIANNLSKFQQLVAASRAGLDIPESRVTNRAGAVTQQVKNTFKRFLLKPLGECEVIFHKALAYYITPQLLSPTLFSERVKARFFPSLIQEYLEKDVELRIFFLDGVSYAMSIFSQLDEQTKVDYRNYNHKKPNRWVPFKLPLAISDSIKIMMESLQLNTGSVDMIKTKDGRYVFLEVNPKGQFDMVSKPCNYYLEEKIALSLIKKKNENVQ